METVQEEIKENKKKEVIKVLDNMQLRRQPLWTFGLAAQKING